MGKKSYIIIGAGRFGTSVIKTLAHTDVEVLAIDKKSESLEAITGIVEDAVCADASDPDVLMGLGVKNYDGAIITFGHDLESRVLITVQLKEMGVPFVMVKAASDIEGRVLTKVGADKLIFPEREMGIHIGNAIARGNLFDSIELNEDHSIVDIGLPVKWVGRTIKELAIRTKYGVSIIGVRREGHLEVNPHPDYVLSNTDELIVLGNNNCIEELREKISKL